MQQLKASVQERWAARTQQLEEAAQKRIEEVRTEFRQQFFEARTRIQAERDQVTLPFPFAPLLTPAKYCCRPWKPRIGPRSSCKSCSSAWPISKPSAPPMPIALQPSPQSCRSA
jgi:hypothetical protein